MQSLQYYIDVFRKLNRARNAKLQESSPHKPVLLLAVIEGFEEGTIATPHIEISVELLASFERIWDELVSGGWVKNFALPFFHLKNEKSGFWHLVPKPGMVIPTTKSKSIRSFKALVETVAFAQIDQDLFYLLINPETRNELKNVLLETYFSRGYSNLKTYANPFAAIEQEPFREPDETYIAQMEAIMNQKEVETRTQSLYVRDQYFKKAIRKIYKNTCAISKLNVITPSNTSLVDGCHIMPFSESFNNSVRNGIALSPTLHRAFDAGIVSIDDDYKVMISNNFRERESSFSIRQYEDQSILLPANQYHYPSQDYLMQHRKKFGLV